MSDVHIRQLMEEDYGTASERKAVRDQLEVLQKGLDICKEISRRPDLGPYEKLDPKFSDLSITPPRISTTSIPARRQVPMPSPQPSFVSPKAPASTITNNDAAPPTPRRPPPPPMNPTPRSSTGSTFADAHGNREEPEDEHEEEDQVQKAIKLSLQEMDSRPGSRRRVDDDAASMNTARKSGRRWIPGRG